MSSEEPAFDAKRVVVVDDEPAVAQTLVGVLEAFGFRAVPFTDPRQALEEVRARVPGVLLLDHGMPSLSGLELVTRLRRELGERCPPTLLVTGRVDGLEPMEQILFDAVFRKPYSVDGLVHAVRRLARTHQERRLASGLRASVVDPRPLAEDA